MRLWSCHELAAEAIPIASAVPPGSRRLTGRAQQWNDRKLGYFGQARYVLFYYEPRGQEVIWDDGRSYGFATGGWLSFHRELGPLARACGADLGDAERTGTDVLLLDRRSGEAFFVASDLARRFVDQRSATD